MKKHQTPNTKHQTPRFQLLFLLIIVSTIFSCRKIDMKNDMAADMLMNSKDSDIIALGESWAYYMGHYLTDKRYTTTSSDQYEQGYTYHNNSPVSGLSSHLNLLEDFSPYRTYDPFYWIPQGLFYDLKDTRNDKSFDATAVEDQVFDYTNQQMFNAFQPSIFSLQDYRVKLLQTTSNPTSGFVPNLFNQYGY